MRSNLNLVGDPTELDLAAPTERLLEAFPDVVYMVDLEGRIRWWNERLAERTGYDHGQLLGMDGFELVPPEDRPAAREAFENADSLAPRYTMELDLVSATGERRPHEFNGMVVEVDGEEVVVAIGRDVTTRHEREAAVRRHRDELDTLNRISETVHEVILAVVEAASREEIESVVCERLVASDLYRGVWIGRRTPDGSLETATAAGESGDFVEAVEAVEAVGAAGDGTGAEETDDSEVADGTGAAEGIGDTEDDALSEDDDLTEDDDGEWRRPAQAAADTGEVRVVRRIQEADLPEPVAALAADQGIHSGISVPVVTRGTVRGVLTVYSGRPDAFSEREQSAFERLGSVVGFAINAVRTERLLLSDTATELTFRVESGAAFLASVSQRADGPVRLEWSAPAESGEGTFRHYVSVEDGDPAAVLAVAEDCPTVERAAHVGFDGSAHVFTVVTSDSITRRLLAVGATTTSAVARDGETTVVAELPGGTEVRPVVETVGELYDAALVSIREVDRQVRTAAPESAADRLTDQQRAALKHAYYGGYFSWPREATAEEVAEVMGVSSPTFHYHLRGAQRVLVEAFLDALGD